VEPFIATGTVSIRRDGSGAEGLFFDEDASSAALSPSLPSPSPCDGSPPSRWVEVTVGVVGPKGRVVALDPSLTVVASGEILSLEEKFQGGTGVNITPLPPSIISPVGLSLPGVRLLTRTILAVIN
jgi:hypothetical protein